MGRRLHRRRGANMGPRREARITAHRRRAPQTRAHPEENTDHRRRKHQAARNQDRRRAQEHMDRPRGHTVTDRGGAQTIRTNARVSGGRWNREVRRRPVNTARLPVTTDHHQTTTVRHRNSDRSMGARRSANDGAP